MIGPKVAQPTASEELRAYALVLERDEERCQRCWRGAVVHRDHRQNRSQGGLTLASNLHLLCPECHEWKTDNGPDAWHDGWGVPGWARPAEYPARRWLRTQVGTLRQAWVLLDDDGNWQEISADEAHRRMEGGAR